MAKGMTFQQRVELSEVTRAIGAQYTQKVICPGCGKVETLDGTAYALGIASRVIKDVSNSKSDGVRWCAVCR